MSRSPKERTLDAQILGRHVRYDYSETWVAWATLGLRVIMAWVFLQAGLDKLFGGGVSGFLDDPLTGGFSAESFLTGPAVAASPAAGFLEWFAELGTITDVLVVWGQILIGLALLVGVAVRFAALMGSLQMFFFWLAGLEGGIIAGLPVEHGYVVDYTLVYIFILFGLGAVGAGRVLGLDTKIEEWDIVQENPWMRYFLG